jgi:hypothetical protein
MSCKLRTVKAFEDHQERINNPDFSNAVKNVYNDNQLLQSRGSEQQYLDYTARVATGILPNQHGAYHDMSKVKDIVYHGTGKKDWKPFKGKNFFTDKQNAKNYANVIASEDFEFTGKITDTKVIPVIINTNPEIVSKNLSIEEIDNYKTNKDGIIANVKEPIGLQKQFVVFEPEQIHILGSKDDIAGFENFVNQSTQKTQYQDNQQNIKNLQNTVDSVEILFDKLNMEYESTESIQMNSVYYNNKMIVNFTNIKANDKWYSFSKPFIETIRKANPYIYEDVLEELKNQNDILEETKNKHEQSLKEYGMNEIEIENALNTEAMERAFEMYMGKKMKNIKKNLMLMEKLKVLKDQMVEYTKGFFKSNETDVVINEEEITYTDNNGNECA